MSKPAYKLEIEKSGLTQKQWYAQIYLKSDHWRSLKLSKYQESGRKCEVCSTTKNLQIHHVNYRNIYDVTTADLRVLCKKHHQEVHHGKDKNSTEAVIAIGDLDFYSPTMQDDVKKLASGRKKAARNRFLKSVICMMRQKKIDTDRINLVAELKSGKHARELKAQRLGIQSSGDKKKWTKHQFESQYRLWLRDNKEASNSMQFLERFRDNLRLRHVRSINSWHMRQNSDKIARPC